MQASPLNRSLISSLGIVTGLLIAVLSVHHAVLAETNRNAQAQTRSVYSDGVARTYDFPWGKDQPFLPSLANTDTGQFFDANSIPTAQYCGHCHEASYHQWRESAHANADRAPWYKANVRLLNTEKGIAFSRHCESCHNPVALFSGALTTGAPENHAYDADGVTCVSCHSVQRIDLRGTGSYVMGIPAVLVDENGAAIQRPVSDGEILAHLDRHSAAVMKPFYKTSEFCAVCHKAALPKELTGYKWQRAMSTYDEWQNSAFAKQSPLPFYTQPAVSTCETCHMEREALVGRDPGSKKGTLASHRWMGGNSLVPAYYGNSEQSARLAAFLKKDVLRIDIFGLQKSAVSAGENISDQPLTAPLGNVGFSLKAREKLTVSVVIQNKGTAHSLVPEQRDMYEAWVVFKAIDNAGRVLGESGALGRVKALDPAAHSFTSRLVNKSSTLNDLHQVWNNRVVAYNNSIQSGRSQVLRYSFTMPVEGAVHLTATVRYRRFNQPFIDFAMGKKTAQPILDIATATRTLAVGDNTPTPPSPGTNPDWMRWNNYGIGSLDARQYPAAVHAFERAAALHPDDPDTHTNISVALIQWEHYDEALALAPENARALYYLALVERNEGKLDNSISHLQKVEAQFPRSRDVHRELGFNFYQQHRYDLARTEYEAVQSIDPDDLAAHYNLAIIYRRLGLTEMSEREARAFADQKDDPAATVLALAYLRKHPDIAQESVPWHVHDLDTSRTTNLSGMTEEVIPAQTLP